MRVRTFCAILLVPLLVAGGFYFYSQQESYKGPQLFLGLGLHVGDITEQVEKARKTMEPDPVMYSIDYFWDELFPEDIARHVLRKNALLNIRWSPVLTDSYDPFSLQDIRDGIWDEHIQSWAIKAREYEYPLLFSFAANFNDKSSGGFVIRDVAAQKNEYLDAYRHVVSVFKDEGAHNVLWLWSVTLTDSSLTFLELMEVYPTGNVVDWVGASVDVNKDSDITDRLEVYRSSFNNEAISKPFILELNYSELGIEESLSFKHVVERLDPQYSDIEALIFNFSGSLPVHTIKAVLKAPYFGRDRDEFQTLLSGENY